MQKFYCFYLFCAIFFLFSAGFAAAQEDTDNNDAEAYPSVWTSVGAPQPPVRTVIPPLPPDFTAVSIPPESSTGQPQAGKGPLPGATAPLVLKIMPGMPDTQGNKIYRIQVGAFSNTDLAWRSYDRLKEAGLTPAFELFGTIYRLVIPGVQAAKIPEVARSIETAGFAEAWIREEN